jgi:putative exporter of polyketide antibiotics
MTFTTEKSHEIKAASAPAEAGTPAYGDGTRQLLQSGLATLAAGILAAALTQFVFGGIGPHGPHTNTGWLLLIVTLMCLPFGFLLSLLGAAKWLRNRRLGGNRLNS